MYDILWKFVDLSNEFSVHVYYVVNRIILYNVRVVRRECISICSRLPSFFYFTEVRLCVCIRIALLLPIYSPFEISGVFLAAMCGRASQFSISNEIKTTPPDIISTHRVQMYYTDVQYNNIIF